MEPRGEAQIFGHRQVAMQTEGLRHITDLRLQGTHLVAQLEAQHAGLVRGNLEQSGDGPQEARLACAVGSDHADDLRTLERKIDPVERLALAEVLAQAAQAERRQDTHHLPSCLSATSFFGTEDARYTLPSVPGCRRAASVRTRIFTR